MPQITGQNLAAVMTLCQLKHKYLIALVASWPIWQCNSSCETMSKADFFTFSASEIWFKVSVTKWLHYLFNVWPFKPIKFAKYKKICQSGFKFWSTLTKPSTNCLRFLKNSQVVKFRQIWSPCSRLSRLIFEDQRPSPIIPLRFGGGKGPP